ncbi:bifunctional metallophosphatase/5'-nucleotidase [Vibrio sp. JPW-9-11-11]|uniref:bifunctional metallophosphatase/5'-nucleotidase n=1 Tax=Vibrio sp. JPW-9-11-11 TaxID=1416532 RepID=UPI0015942E9B|nr:bifunctional metallophosphatase/5'-nucleotidase [Vibrio sp. JPW-9-11-11]NVD07917.1 bifunctional metallophosphatase/5'-nucleotidase [Vibrio sp. JPW-9-11-11]
MTNKNYNVTKLRLAHINDTHSYFEPTSLQLAINVDGVELSPFVSAGGFARIATRVEQLKQQAEQDQKGFLFLHAGDCFQGTLYFSLFKGEANATLLNALEIDAMALGNHELDMGNEPVAHFVHRIQFPLLAGNWDLSNESTSKRMRLRGHRNIVPFDAEKRCADWIEKKVGDDKVAIFSLALDKMADISNPDWDTPFVDAIETAKNTVAAIEQAGINKIILLSHMGYESDLDLANHVDGISVIVGGHSHRLQGDFSQLGLAKDDPYGVKVNQTYVVQAGMHALSLGHCDLEFAPDGTLVRFEGKNELLLGRRLFIDASMNETHNDSPYQVARSYIDAHPNVVVCKKQQSLQTLLEKKYTSQVRQLQQQVIATCEHKLRHIRIPDQQGPSEIAPLVAESFTYQMETLGHSIDFAIHNAGGVRNSLSAGEVSVADIAGKLLPFAVPIGIYHIAGREISKILEGAINNALNNGVVGTGDGSYPYTHKLSFKYCCDAPLGSRIKELMLLNSSGEWVSVEDDKIYCGTSSAYTMKGKEGYEAITNMQGEGTITSFSMADCLITLLQDQPNALNRRCPTTVNQKWHKGC